MVTQLAMLWVSLCNESMFYRKVLVIHSGNIFPFIVEYYTAEPQSTQGMWLQTAPGINIMGSDKKDHPTYLSPRSKIKRSEKKTAQHIQVRVVKSYSLINKDHPAYSSPRSKVIRSDQKDLPT